MDNVNVHFRHEVFNMNVENGKCHFQVDNFINKTIEALDVIGDDGAKVCRALMKCSLVNFFQTYIDHGYFELSIPPTSDGDFAREINCAFGRGMNS